MSPKRRKLWKEEDVKAAIISVRNKVMGLQRASNTFNVPKSTLKDKVNSKEEDVDKLVSTKLGRKPVLPFELEDSLVSYCLEMEKQFYGLSAKDVKTMAFQLASLNGLKHPFSKNDEAAGWKWLHSFLRRHQELSLRKPQSTSMARIRGFNQENVIKFFDVYEPLMNIINHSPNRLYNCDETGLTVVQHKVNKVVSLKGKRQVGSVSSAERGSLVTAVTCMSAAGLFLNVKPTKDDPIILVLDGHYSHTRNVELLELARANGVHIVCLPPHCTHKMQPLDVAFMLPFKTYYAQAIEQWLKQNAGRVVTHYQRKSPTDKKTYERKSVQKKQADKVPTQSKRQKKQSQICSDSEGEELDDPVYISTDNEDSEDDAECPYCNGKFSCDKRGKMDRMHEMWNLVPRRVFGRG
ncbi:hypothetical protein ANN_03781 [Periplaneta americana]|uniref:HTH CENPB-type domain-containing protein n=1 Tax=Periplaneta americana TaxID=6978 RepID=A0ABQ8TZV7_PERAM|nr:hypothetical protein ANN_03781 [Periplaneta americana]